MNRSSYQQFRYSLSVILIIVITSFASSCAKKISFQHSTVVPAAEGRVKIDKDKNKNYRISISLANLAGPDKLDPPKSNYVVWMTSNTQTNPQNMGRINTSSGFFSNKLKASFETVTSFSPTRVFITAEDDATTQVPGIQLILTTSSF